MLQRCEDRDGGDCDSRSGRVEVGGASVCGMESAGWVVWAVMRDCHKRATACSRVAIDGGEMAVAVGACKTGCCEGVSGVSKGLWSTGGWSGGGEEFESEELGADRDDGVLVWVEWLEVEGVWLRGARGEAILEASEGRVKGADGEGACMACRVRGALDACKSTRRRIRIRSCSRFASRHRRVESMSSCGVEDEAAEAVDVDDLVLCLARIRCVSVIANDSVLLLESDVL